MLRKRTLGNKKKSTYTVYSNCNGGSVYFNNNLVGIISSGKLIVELSGDNPYRYRTGVPEFWEDDKPLHAAGGSNSQSLQIISDFTEGSGETVTRHYNSGDNGIQRGGGGYGGGGAGVTYSSSKSFSSGGSGIVIIRYKAYE